MLQVVGQVAARQLDGATVGAGDHVEGAGGEVALGEREGVRHKATHNDEIKTATTTDNNWGETDREREGGRGRERKTEKERKKDKGFSPAAASSVPSSDSPPRCGCSGSAEPGSAAPAPGLGRSEEEKMQDEAQRSQI